MRGLLSSTLAVSAFVFNLGAQDPGPGVHRETLGKLEVTCLQDGLFQLPTDLLIGITSAEAKVMLGGKDKAPTAVNTFLVRLGSKLILVDTGTGKAAWPDAGHLMEKLKLAAVDPAKIDLVLITHFHMDHLLGITKADGSRAFPNAVVRVAQAEHDYWLEGDPSKLPEAARSRVAPFKAAIAPYQAAGAYQPFAPGANLGEGIRVLPAAGHTPGHSVYGFRSEGKELWCVGDLIHFGAIQFQKPSVAVSFDTDSPVAVTARKALFRKAAEEHALLAGAHLPFPGLFRLEVKGDGFAVTPKIKP